MLFKSPIIIVPGEPKSIFMELFFKSLKKIKVNNPIILIASKKLLNQEMRKFNYKRKIKIVDQKNLNYKQLKNNFIHLINVDENILDNDQSIKKKSNVYLNKCFEIAFEIIKKYKLKKFINGPINKKSFLDKKFLGMTEFISNKFKIKKNAMLIYNKNLSVCPLTTHLPIKFVAKKINKKIILEKVQLIHNFYKSKFKIKPKIGILSLNPHGESIDKFNEDEKIIKPCVKYLRTKNYFVNGPVSADTAFLKQNRGRYDVLLGMYHDQVLTPIKTLFEYDAINITLGLPFYRVTPDHGPNEKMIGKNTSNPLSLIQAIRFLDKN
ncbi:4-hydroxythreonine-4-phosphate dehydrogenase PdxA [Candidatus Pelagibacter sp. HIMB1542]|uniref:4-hydroxythreonine-4-phosphate dehydrogenase PdxA n=1 Tax=Candidatus Pelagibacter sp. HIMB1542 TaxID=3413346 RepID=UPI003F8781C7